MGISTATAEFLVKARAQGLQLGQTLTLGHQNMFISPVRLGKLLKRNALFPAGMTDDEFYRRQFSSPYMADEFFRVLGATSLTSMDMSVDESNSIAHDLNLPVADDLKERFDTLIDGGTLEHVFNFPVAIKSCMEMVRVGGTLIVSTPSNNYFGHGFYQFTSELFYRVFSPANGFEVQRLHMVENEIFPGKVAGRSIPVEYVGKQYSVPDPAKLNRRVLLASKRPAVMLVQARRVERREIFKETPQQSDYVTAWQNKPADPVPAKLEFNEKWARLKDAQLYWLPMLCRLTPLFFWRALRKRSLANREDFTPV